jgi:hypothetical protein
MVREEVAMVERLRTPADLPPEGRLADDLLLIACSTICCDPAALLLLLELVQTGELTEASDRDIAPPSPHHADWAELDPWFWEDDEIHGERRATVGVLWAAAEGEGWETFLVFGLIPFPRGEEIFALPPAVGPVVANASAVLHGLVLAMAEHEFVPQSLIDAEVRIHVLRAGVHIRHSLPRSWRGEG